MCGGNSTWSLRWVTGVLCGLCALTCLPNVLSFPGPTPAVHASPTGPQPPIAAGNKNGSTDLTSTVSAPIIPKPHIQRALAVLVLVSAAVIVYFVIRIIRTRRKNKKTRKYGVLDTNIGNMELTPLEQEDEDDDTLFDANHPRR